MLEIFQFLLVSWIIGLSYKQALIISIGFFYSLGLRCVSHTLLLAVIDCLKEASVCAILNKVRALVKKLRNQTYMYLIKKEKLKTPILDCLTRWHSIQYVICWKEYSI